MRATAWAAGLMALTTLASACGGGPGTRAIAVSSETAGTFSAPVPLPPAQRRALAARYIAIAEPANARLDAAVTRFHEHQSRDLLAATADLKQQASIERRFDQELLTIDFPVLFEMIAMQLVRANEARANLAMDAAMSPSLLALASFEPAQAATDARVEQQVNIIRRQLGLPAAERS